MTVTSTLRLDSRLGKHDAKLLPNSLIGSTSMKNLGCFSTLDCRSLNWVHLTAFNNH
jgi:hypothetical protein